MTIPEINSASQAPLKVKQKAKANGSTSPIRVRRSTRDKLDELLRRVNKQKLGRKVKIDDLIYFSIELLNDVHLELICDKALTNKDRMELLFQKFSKERRGATREEFFGMLLEGKVTI